MCYRALKSYVCDGVYNVCYIHIHIISGQSGDILCKYTPRSLPYIEPNTKPRLGCNTHTCNSSQSKTQHQMWSAATKQNRERYVSPQHKKKKMDEVLTKRIKLAPLYDLLVAYAFCHYTVLCAPHFQCFWSLLVAATRNMCNACTRTTQHLLVNVNGVWVCFCEWSGNRFCAPNTVRLVGILIYFI